MPHFRGQLVDLGQAIGHIGICRCLFGVHKVGRTLTIGQCPARRGTRTRHLPPTSQISKHHGEINTRGRRIAGRIRPGEQGIQRTLCSLRCFIHCCCECHQTLAGRGDIIHIRTDFRYQPADRVTIIT